MCQISYILVFHLLLEVLIYFVLFLTFIVTFRFIFFSSNGETIIPLLNASFIHKQNRKEHKYICNFCLLKPVKGFKSNISMYVFIYYLNGFS